LKAGSIEFGGGGAVDCTIKNLSGVGAAVEVASPVGIPQEITLNMLNNNQRQNCRVVWRKEKRIGLACDPVS